MTFLPKTDPAKTHSRKDSGFWWKIAGAWWKLTNILEKWAITWQDRLGGLSYAKWIRTVEREAIAQASRDQPQKKAQIPSICFLINPEGFSQDDVRLTLESLNRITAGEHASIVVQESRDEAGALAGAADRLPGEWVVPIGAGDRLSPAWLDLFCLFLERNPEADIVYWDEDMMDAGEQRVQPFFKPDWSPELLYSLNYLESAAFRKTLFSQYRGLQRTSQAGWIFDVTQLARQISHIPFVLQHRPAGRQLRMRAFLEQHAQDARAYLEQRGYRDVVATVNENNVLRFDWAMESPLVSIIIPTKNNLAYLRRCLTTLYEKTSYPSFEIVLMDDHSTDPGVLAYYQELLARHANIHLHANEGPFNYSRVNNQGARLAKGDLLLFLNNDVEIIDGEWLTEMVRWAQAPGVGMVGAKLLYPDGSIQHAGIVLGLTGHAGHVYAGKPALSQGFFVPAEAYRNVSAVTGACMLVRREPFLRLGGFDERLGLVFNDVDLGVRFGKSGWRVVYTPAAVLIHHEGRSRGRHIPPEDIRLGAQSLAEDIAAGDRYYNPNLSLAVNWPTLVRQNESRALARLQQIVKFKG